MAAFTVRVTGLRELDAKLAALGPNLGPQALTSSLVYAAAPTVQLARSLAPYDATRKSGKHLRDQIGVTTQRPRNQAGFAGAAAGYARIVPRAPHSHLLEFGHKIVVGGRAGRLRRLVRGRNRGQVVGGGTVVGFVKARPFLGPAWNATRETVLHRFITRIGEIVSRVWRGGSGDAGQIRKAA